MANWRWEVEEDEPFNPDEFYGGPSKSQRKRDMIALQKLGGQLVEQSAERIRKCDIPDDLRNAILECQRIKNREGHRRQLQFIGKLMRGLTEEQVESIKQQIESWKGLSKADTVLLHAVESQRTQLLENPNAFTDFMKQFPQADSQQIRTLIRNAKKEQEAKKPPKAYRELYKVIRALISEQQGAPVPAPTVSDEETEA